MKKKALIIAAIIVLLLVALDFLRQSVLVPQPKETNEWVLLCQENFQRIHDAKTLHYSYEEDSIYVKRGTSFRTNYDCWVNGSDMYSIFDSSHSDVTEVLVGQEGYRKENKENWKPYSNIAAGIPFRYEEWDEFLKDKTMSVNFVKDGTEVSFYEDLGYHNCTLSRQTREYVFCFDKDKKLLCVKDYFVTYNHHEIASDDLYIAHITVNYFDFPEEEVVSKKIQKAFDKASK